MDANRPDYKLNDKDLNFDFEEWAALFKESPQAFETRRLIWNKQIIDNAPDASQRRLSGLLFQINMEKRRSKNALNSCIRISELMWKQVNELNDELQQFVHKPAITSPRPEIGSIGEGKTDTKSGLVYPFPSRSPEK